MRAKTLILGHSGKTKSCILFPHTSDKAPADFLCYYNWLVAATKKPCVAVKTPLIFGKGTLDKECEMSKKKQMDNQQSDDEEALRKSEEKYRTLFNSIDEGFVVAELLFNDEDKPFDLLVLETN